MGSSKRNRPCLFHLATSRRRLELVRGVERLRHLPRIPRESRRTRKVPERHRRRDPELSTCRSQYVRELVEPST